MTLQFGLTPVITSPILQGAAASPLDIGGLCDPPQPQPRHYSHYRVTIVLRTPPPLLSHSRRMCRTRLILRVKHPWYLRRSRDLRRMRSGAAASSGGSQWRSAGVIPSIACVSVQSTYSWLWGQLTRLSILLCATDFYGPHFIFILFFIFKYMNKKTG